MKNLKYFVFTFISFLISLSVVKAEAVCVYKQGDFKVTCTTSGNSVSCVNNSNNDIIFNFSSMSLSYSDFVSGSSLKCPGKVYIELYQEFGSNIIEIKNIRISSSGSNSLALSNDADESKVSSTSTQPSTEVNEGYEYESDPDYIAAKKDADLYCNPQNIGYQDDVKCEEAKIMMENAKNKYVVSSNDGDDSLDLDNPCKGKVLAVFTTIGWVFFIIKILVPILLIVFGTIDVSKAVVSSKDDEIKKSVKTLVIRAIAGVIIFFIPTLITFIVNVIGNNASDVYHGTFYDCTKCILKPNQTNCPSLGGN